MADKYKQTYRVASARLASWDYGRQAMYFVTICTAAREHFFGKIVNGVMQLTEIGRAAEDEWIKTPSIRADMNLELDAFCVMPNHVHAIIAIGDNIYNTGSGAMYRAAISGATVTNQFGPQSKNLASIVRGYKSAVTTRARVLGLRFGWQARYHDHIIRNQGEFQRIQAYVIRNPQQWQADRWHGS